MKTNIYWSYSRITPLRDSLDMLWEEPTSLLSEVKEEIKKNTLPDLNTDKEVAYLKCPSLLKELSSTYVIKSPVDYTFTWTGDSLSSTSLDQDFFNRAFYVRDLKSGMLSFNFRIIFLADSPTNLIITGAHFSNNNFTNNVRIFPGSFDVSKWFRPVDFTFQVKDKNKPIEIKRGDHLMYVKFDTENAFNLKKFYMTEEIDGYAAKCMDVKHFLPGKPLNFLYDIFTKKSNFNKKVLKLVKENTVG